MALAEVLAQSPGDLNLECGDGTQLQVHKAFLSVASSVFSSAFSSENKPCSSMKVEGSGEAWTCVMEMLYPVYPRPELSFNRVAAMLRILHMYDFSSFLKESLAFLSKHFPDGLSPEPNSPCYILSWLALADDLQLQELQRMCMQKVREMSHSRRIESALLAAAPHPPARVPVVPKPLACPRGHVTGRLFSGESICPMWCSSCKAWVCCAQASSFDGDLFAPPGGSFSFGPRVRVTAATAFGDVHSCQACGRPVQHEPPQEEVRWFQSDSPHLSEGIRGLSRQALEDLLASVVAAGSGSYSNCLRPAD